MKKLSYLLAFIALAFTACQKQPIIPVGAYTKSMTFTLAATDYQLLSGYPSKTLSFYSTTDAYTYIPQILSDKEPQLGDGSKATVTFTIGAAASVKVADSLYSDVAYTVTSADYFAVTGNHYGDFSASDVLSFLAYKYPTPAANRLAVISYILYSGGTDAAVTNSFLYLNGAWIKIYQVSPAQYTEVGDGKYDDFSSSEQSKLPGYFNFFLKNDVTIMDTARVNDVEYVSYQIYTGSTNQKVMTLEYDGNNWVQPFTTTGTIAFLKTAGVWVANQTVYYVLTSADTKLIAASNIGTAAERTNLGKYGDFSAWPAADLQSAMILVLTTDFPNPKLNTDYVVTYLNYTGGSDVPTQLTFQNNGTAWVAK